MKKVRLFEAFVNEAKKPTIEVSLRHARTAGEAFRDAYSKMGKMTSTNTFEFKNVEDAEDFAGYLTDYIEIPEDEITSHNLDESKTFEAASSDAYAIHRMTDMSGQDKVQDFIDDNKIDVKKLIKDLKFNDRLKEDLTDALKGDDTKLKRIVQKYKK